MNPFHLVSNLFHPHSIESHQTHSLTKEDHIMATSPVSAPEGIVSKIEGDIVSFFEFIGHEATVALHVIQPFLIPVETLASIMFPAQAAVIDSVINATGLIQQSVAIVEQKYSSIPKGTASNQKLADVLSMTQDVVIAALKEAHITSDTAYVTRLVKAVVAILNVQTVPASA